MEENTTPSQPPAPPPPPAANPIPQPGFSPPPVISAVAPSASRKGRGWKILAIVLLLLLAVSMLWNMSNIAGAMFSGGAGSYSAHNAGPRLQELVREDNDSAHKIAVVEIDGIITSSPIDAAGFSMVDVIKAQLNRAAEDARVKAVILKVDSPGGEVLASDEIYRAVQDFQETSDKPVIASMGSVAASGGYYVSAPCRWIVANELTLTGSIGVIMQGYNYRGLMDKVGLRPIVYKSGKFKDMLSGSRLPSDIPEEERQMVQNLIDDTYSRFKEIVQEGRSNAKEMNKDSGRPLAKDWSELADGRVLSGKQAHQSGFVDELGNFQDAINRAKEIAGIPNADLVLYRQLYDLADFFRLFGKTEVSTVKVDLGMEVPKIHGGRLYFLSPVLLY